MMYETIFGQVVSKANNYQAVPDAEGGRRIIKNARISQYEKNFAHQCTKYRGKQINCRFILHIHVYEQSRSYDLDNALKTVLDCLQYVGAITNDNLCYQIDAHKHLDRYQPRITFAIEEIEPDLFRQS